jgi:acetate kinase
MSELLNRAKDGDGEAKLAIDLYVYRIQKYLAAFDCAAGGAMAFLFGGGVVEHSPEILQLVFASPYFETVIPHLASNELEAPITRLSTNQRSATYGRLKLMRRSELCLICIAY